MDEPREIAGVFGLNFRLAPVGRMKDHLIEVELVAGFTTTMTPAQMRALAGRLRSIADAAEKGPAACYSTAGPTPSPTEASAVDNRSVDLLRVGDLVPATIKPFNRGRGFGYIRKVSNPAHSDLFSYQRRGRHTPRGPRAWHTGHVRDRHSLMSREHPSDAVNCHTERDNQAADDAFRADFRRDSGFSTPKLTSLSFTPLVCPIRRGGTAANSGAPTGLVSKCHVELPDGGSSVPCD